jgi:hypothetical protein
MRNSNDYIIQKLLEMLPCFDSIAGDDNMPESLLSMIKEILKKVESENLDATIMSYVLFLLGKAVYFKNAPDILSSLNKIGGKIQDPFVARQYLIVLDNLLESDLHPKTKKTSVEILKLLSPGLSPWDDDPVLLRRVLQGFQYE